MRQRIAIGIAGTIATVVLLAGLGPLAVTLLWRMLGGTTVVRSGYSFTVPPGWVISARDEGGISLFLEGPTPALLLRVLKSSHAPSIPSIAVGAYPDGRGVGIAGLLAEVPRPSRQIQSSETGIAICAEGPVARVSPSFEMMACEWPGGVNADYAGYDRALFLNFVRSVRSAEAKVP